MADNIIKAVPKPTNTYLFAQIKDSNLAAKESKKHEKYYKELTFRFG